MGLFPVLLWTFATSSITSTMLLRLEQCPSGVQQVMWNWLTWCAFWVYWISKMLGNGISPGLPSCGGHWESWWWNLAEPPHWSGPLCTPQTQPTAQQSGASTGNCSPEEILLCNSVNVVIICVITPSSIKGYLQFVIDARFYPLPSFLHINLLLASSSALQR